MRSAFVPVLAPIVALIAALARWATQGSGNLYTAIDKRFYVPDRDLGWRVSDSHPIWLGLEVCAVIAVIAIGLAIGGLVIRKLEARGRRMRALRVASWIVALVPLAVPIAAFSTGGAPANARDVLPAAQMVALETGIDAALDLPAGTYSVVAHSGSALTAKLTAGGEAFDARFATIAGTIALDPHSLSAPVRGTISTPTSSIDTGIGERSKHARDSYLRAAEFPQITFTADELVAARQDTASVVAFRARGTVGLIGKTHAVEITGTISKPDAAARTRLGLEGDVMIVVAQFSLRIAETALAPDAGDFDGDRIPIFVSLILRHTGALES